MVTTALGAFNTYTISTDNILSSCGKNEYGELGDGTTIDRLEPVQVDCILLDTEDLEISQQVLVYPNPTQKSIHIVASQKGTIEQISIIDLTGKFIIKDQLFNNEEVNADFLDAGLYILQIVLNGEIHNIKLIKN
jgi:hypothetical protein